MDNKFYYFYIILIICLSNLINAQDENLKTNQWVKIDKELIYSIVIATDINQQITKGLLYGMKGDSIYLSLKNEMIKLNIRDLITLSIEDRRTSNRGFVFGTIGGMYLGTLLFLLHQKINLQVI